MASMKHLLKFLAAVGITSVSATTVVACGDTSNPTVTMDGTVADFLGLTTGTGKTGALTPTITFTGTDASWTINSASVTASRLLVGDATSGQVAAKAGCDAFLTSVLGMTADKDSKYDAAAVAALKIQVTLNSDVALAVINSKTDYYISAGTVKVQFMQADGTTKLGSEYTCPLKFGAAGDTTGVVATSIPQVAIADTDVTTNTNIMFKVAEAVPTDVNTATVGWNSTATDSTKKFTSLNALIKKNLKLVVKSHTAAGANWATSDTLVLNVTGDGGVTLGSDITFTL